MSERDEAGERDERIEDLDLDESEEGQEASEHVVGGSPPLTREQ